MRPTGILIRTLRFLLPLLILGALATQVAVAAPIAPPASLTPPLPPNAIDPVCFETSSGITCAYRQEFPAEAAPHPFVTCDTTQTFEQGTGTHANVTRFYDLSGALITEVRQVRYAGVLSSTAQPDVSGSRSGFFIATIDYQSGAPTRITFTGLTALVVVEGRGVVALDAGRVVVDPVANTIVSAAGRHDFIFPGLFGPGLNLQNAPANTQRICGALA